MKMKWIIFNFFILMSAHAQLEGEYQFVTGSSLCSPGKLNVYEKKFKKDRVIHLGKNKLWTLNLNDKSNSTFKIKNGCSLNVSYEKTELSLIIKTQKSSCPVVLEDGDLQEQLVLAGKNLSYIYKFTPKSIKGKVSKFNCLYVKSN